MATELFTRDGKPFATLIETSDGQVVTQEWRYAADAAPYAGAQPGQTTLNFRLVDPNGDVEPLIAAYLTALSQDGFRGVGKGGEAEARSFIARTRGHGVLEVTNAA